MAFELSWKGVMKISMSLTGLCTLLIHAAEGVKIHPLYPMATQVCSLRSPCLTLFQPSWQASVPVPINILYDVPNSLEYDEDVATLSLGDKPSAFSQTRLENTSFALTPERLIAQAVTPEQFSIRLHAPEVRNI
jgi:hypothetical protein